MRFSHGSFTGSALLLCSAQSYLLHCKAGPLAVAKGSVNSGAPVFVSYILAKAQAYFRYRETVRELALLSDRELTDLGIARFQIDSIARRSAAA